MGSLAGAIKTAAKRIGISEERYRSHLSAGLKWCCLCKSWKRHSEFAKCKPETDGLQGGCSECMNGRQKKKYVHRQRSKLLALRTPIRDGDKRQANAHVQRLVDAGILPRPRSVPCFDCGHVGDDRRHHYDHYLGYSVEHHEDVQAVCVQCHIKRGIARGELNFGRGSRMLRAR